MFWGQNVFPTAGKHPWIKQTLSLVNRFRLGPRLGICGTPQAYSPEATAARAGREVFFFLMGEYNIIIISNDVDIYIYTYISI